MKNIIALGLIILAFFYPWISLCIISIVVLYLSYVYYSTTKKSSLILSTYKNEIITYFNGIIGNGEFHYNYVKKSSQYFLFPGSSKIFAKLLTMSFLTLIIVVIIQFFRFDSNYLFIGLSIPIIILAIIIGQSFEKPILDYQNRNKSHIKNTPLYTGVDAYPEFFYHGPWNQITNNN
tara:strand:- start:1819 stop:2349 length:531 start_codon:yes stop_codon:yes gene_type:complete